MKPPRTVDPRLAGVQPQMLAATLDADRKPLADADWRRHIGRTIDRALEIAGVTKQCMSAEMGYRDQGSLSRWIAGVERPHFDKLFAVDRFYDAWIIACAETNPRVEVETLVRIKKVA